MAADKKVLFITARQKSLGETYTAARFAQGMRAQGWEPHFLAFKFAAPFLRDQGLKFSVLGDSFEENCYSLSSAVASLRPRMIIISDYYLFSSADVSRVWSNERLFDFDLPVASFDHMKFHPDPRSLYMAFLRMAPRRPESLCFPVDRLPSRVAALLRPCPLHDTASEADSRIFKFNPFDSGKAEGSSQIRVRERLGFSSREKIVYIPVGSWAAQAARDLKILFYYQDIYPDLLRHYLRRTPGEIRFILVSGEFERARKRYGRVTVEFYSTLPFDAVQDLLRAADLVLCDNVTSSSLSRAVLEGVPAAATINSVRSVRDGSRVTFQSAFELSHFVAERLAAMEAAAPNSVFPYAVFPLGWEEEMRPLFDKNRYSSTFERIELFDEKGATDRLERLLFDRSFRNDLSLRQAAYAAQAKQLPSPGDIAEQVTQRFQTGGLS